MKTTKVPVTIKYGGRAHTIVGQKFKPGNNQVHYWFPINLSPKRDEFSVVLYDLKGETDYEHSNKFWWYFENPERDYISRIVAKALEKQSAGEIPVKAVVKKASVKAVSKKSLVKKSRTSTGPTKVKGSK